MTLDVVALLVSRSVPDQALGAWRPVRTIFGVPRPAVIDPTGRAWRLGALLIDSSGALYATGQVTRALVPKDFNSDKTVAGENRREVQRAAARGAFRAGEAVNYDYRKLSLDPPSPPLSLVDGVLHVTDGATVPLLEYLRDRVELLGF